MNIRPGNGRAYPGRKIAVRDQANAGTGCPNAVDQRFVPSAVEADDGQVVDVTAQAAGDILQILLDRSVDIDRAAAGRANDDLVHIDIRRIKQAAAFGCSEDGDRVVGPERT